MSHSIKKFFEKVGQDEELKNSLLELKEKFGTDGKTTEEYAAKISEMASGIGFDISADRFKEYIVAATSDEMKEEELKTVAGGECCPDLGGSASCPAYDGGDCPDD